MEKKSREREKIKVGEPSWAVGKQQLAVSNQVYWEVVKQLLITN